VDVSARARVVTTKKSLFSLFFSLCQLSFSRLGWQFTGGGEVREGSPRRYRECSAVEGVGRVAWLTCSRVKLLMRASGVFLSTNFSKSGCRLHRARSSPKRNPDAKDCGEWEGTSEKNWHWRREERESCTWVSSGAVMTGPPDVLSYVQHRRRQSERTASHHQHAPHAEPPPLVVDPNKKLEGLFGRGRLASSFGRGRLASSCPPKMAHESKPPLLSPIPLSASRGETHATSGVLCATL
jgi:hypothetical protein